MMDIPTTYETETNVERLKAQRDGWEETAKQHLRNEEYYHTYRNELIGVLLEIYNEHPGIVLDARPDFITEFKLLDRDMHAHVAPPELPTT